MANLRITTGQTDFSGGVDSSKTQTMASPQSPNGLKPNQLYWANNCTMRTAGIYPRSGYRYLATLPLGLFQGGSMYEPDNEFPYLIVSISGRIYRVRVDLFPVTIDEITIAGDPNPATEPLGFMTQGEQFLVIQAGDFTTNALFWDGSTLRRSLGQPGGELPPAGPMDYYMGRIWLASGREYVAGDIVFGPSGTAPYEFRDAILKMTENAYTAGGGTFIVPTNAGNIRALSHPANLDTALGEGQLIVFTRKAIYSTTVTPKRADWILLTEPLQRVIQRTFGSTAHRSVVPVNGDLFYQSIDGVRSLIQAIRYFEQWGNTPISEEEQRAIDGNDKSLSRFGTATEFDNRLLTSCLPYQTPHGIANKALMSLNFDLLNSIQQKLPPVWEGVWEGLNFMQTFNGDFGGRPRMFTVAWSDRNSALELWEVTKDDKEDTGKDGSNRIIWSFETPSYTWGDPFQLKQLESAEFWVDRLSGLVEFKVEYKNDQGCWIFWKYWKECAQRDECDSLTPPEPCDYPTQTYCPQYRATMVLPKPPVQCDPNNARPSDMGYSFALRVSIKGYCRIRGIMVHATDRSKAPYEGIRCNV